MKRAVVLVRWSCLAEKLKRFGVPTELLVLEGERHGFTDATNQESMKTMMEFLARRLKR